MKTVNVLAALLLLGVPAAAQFNGCSPGPCNPASRVLCPAPVVNGACASGYANAAANIWWYNGALYSSKEAWVTAIGGTFARGSAGTYVDAAGAVNSVSSNVLRVDYSTSSPGMYFEGARTNILLRSQAWATSPWTVFNISSTNPTVTNNNAVAPDGTSTATTVDFPAITGGHSSFVRETVTGLTNPSVLSPSLWAKATQAVSLGFRQGNGAAGLVGVSVSTAYQRIIAAPGSNASTAFNFDFGAGALADNPAVTISGWGAQLEVGPAASSYIVTVGATASRSADTLSAAISGVTSFTVYALADAAEVGTAHDIFQIDDGTAGNRGTLSFNGSAAGAFDLLSGGVSQAALSTGTVAANTGKKIVAAFAANDVALMVNGGTLQTDASATVPSFSAFRLGSDTSGTANLFGHIAEIAWWSNVRGSNSELQRLVQ